VRGPEFSFSLCLSLLHTLTLTQGTVRRISVPLFPSQSRERHILLYHSLSLSLSLSFSLSRIHPHIKSLSVQQDTARPVSLYCSLSLTHTHVHTHTRAESEARLRENRLSHYPTHTPSLCRSLSHTHINTLCSMSGRDTSLSLLHIRSPSRLLSLNLSLPLSLLLSHTHSFLLQQRYSSLVSLSLTVSLCP